MVGFHDFDGVDIAPVLKKTAVKILPRLPIVGPVKTVNPIVFEHTWCFSAERKVNVSTLCRLTKNIHIT